MSVMTAVETEIGRPIDAERGVTGSHGVAAIAPAFGAGRRSAVRLLAAGTAALVAAAGLGFATVGHPHKPGVPAPAPVEQARAANSTVRAEDVVVVDLTYEPGHSSGWHVHPGLHAVYVLSGSLTVYDAACQAHTYGPGDSYVGGQSPHVARNETDAPLEMVVTAIEVTGPAGPGSHLPAPAGCPVS